MSEQLQKETERFIKAYRKKTDAYFEPLTITHDECLSRLACVVEKLPFENVTKAFLSSFSTRRLELRSALPSYVAACILLVNKEKQCLETHHFETHPASYYASRPYEWPPVVPSCRICEAQGIYSNENYEEEDLNILNYERVMYGGVRHSHLEYIMFDLEEFAKLDVPEPTDKDIEIFQKILEAAENCPTGASPGKLRDKLKEIKEFKSNKDERSILLDVLAMIGILCPKSFDRNYPVWSDWRYFKHWKGGDGYNHKTVDIFFGSYLPNKEPLPVRISGRPTPSTTASTTSEIIA